MKALTLTQPWASLVALGAKKIETRSWKTAYRGPLAIHAAKGFPKDAQRLVLEDWNFFTPLAPYHAQSMKAAGAKLIFSGAGRKVLGALPLGSVIATCDLVDCKEIVSAMSPGEEEEVAIRRSMIAPLAPEFYFGNYEPGRYGWFLENIKLLPEPIPAKGALSLWQFDGL